MPTSPFLDWNGNTFGITDEALWVNIRNTTSTAVPVTPTGDGVISAGNTTEVNLAGGATFEGTFENCLEYGAAEKTSDSGRAQDEIILKSNTVYVVRYEEITATTRLVIHLEWYEDLGV